MSKSSLRVDWATHESAKYACEKWHYSRCLPIGKLVKVGAWEDDKFIGVVIFGRGASPFLGAKLKLPQSECCELVRVAFTDHRTPVTRIVGLALKFLKRQNPGMRMVVSFADPSQGHVGGIYQAGNWIYTGKSNQVTELFIKGRWIHMRGGYHQMTKSTPRRTMPGKHRYLMPLDESTRTIAKELAKPYPKRVRDVDGDTPASQAGEGGSIPTRTLHSIDGDQPQ